jgi:hypothetical protein
VVVPVGFVRSKPVDAPQRHGRLAPVDDNGNDIPRPLGSELSLVESVLQLTLKATGLGNADRRKEQEHEVRFLDAVIDLALPIVSGQKVLLVKPCEDSVLKEPGCELFDECRIFPGVGEKR